ncbi:hypothetical protein SynMITS9220_00860 [Synechococcus sp. MIT S9220]|nr:hypothetical protein SynMITS9220_00860 [Synechococcus sp. MIT S9220]
MLSFFLMSSGHLDFLMCLCAEFGLALCDDYGVMKTKA